MAAESSNGFVRVNFSRRGFAKIVPNTKRISGFTPNPVALVTFGQFLASLDIPSQGAPIFLSIPEFRGIDYVGYVIEKERLDPTNGTWQRLSEYHVIGVASNSYEDSRVAYGQTYRYRMRSVVKFTTFDDVDALNNTQATLSLLTAVQTAVGTAISANQRVIQALASQNSLTAKGATLTTTDIAGIAGFNAQNFFTFNVNDPKSSSRLTTIQNTVQKYLNQVSGNTPVDFSTLLFITNWLAASGVALAQPPKTYYSEYIASFPSRNWKYVTISNQRIPPPPSSIKIIPSTPQRQITITWLAPVDDQQDLAYFTLYRRNALGQPWELLEDNIGLTDNVYVDTDVDIDKQYIYALITTDLHGYTSFLSTQVQAQLNPSFETEKKERLLVWISGEGARVDEPDTVFKAFYDPFEQIIAKKNIRLTIADGFADDSASMIVRVKSLDTQESQDIKVTLTNISQ